MITKKIMYHEPFDARLDEAQLEELQDNEVRCRALKSLISTGSELISFRRQFDPSMHRCSELGHPQRVGYSMAGEGIQTGAGGKDYKVGDKVYAHVSHQSLFNVPEGIRLFKMPEYLTPDEICFLTVLKAGLFAAMKANIKITDTIVAAGLGLYGIASLQFAHLFGASRIIAIDPVKARAERALQFGATHVICDNARDARDQVLAINGGRLADAGIDATASAQGLAQVSMLVRNGGRVSLIADPANLESQCPGTNMLRGYLTIHGIFIDMMEEIPNAFYPAQLQDVHRALCELLRDRRIHVKDMITDYVSPADPTAVYQKLYDNRFGSLGVLYDWSLLEGK